MAKKSKKSAKAGKLQLEPIESPPDAARESEIPAPVPTTGIEDPLGDVSDGEARTYLGDEVEAEAGAETSSGSEGEPAHPEEAAEHAELESETVPAPRPPAKLERLQKILSQAGIASRRKAEEMIEQGRVQVNGKVVTELGTKADAARDHIRVDGKLLHGAERLRYFVLNKPRGYVTTVSDPEGRPTVMQFFEKMRERLYPVGRLDYMSEGLLLVTNDGELANRLTKAGSGVEKTYLVKVAGQPSEEELNILRGGVAIERGKPGTPKVHTSPARIRQVRQGDNPWYEVVLIEGRNRELRKMFSAIGHFVEKIRRVGYGPLVLDQEPGKLRELEPDELAALRLTAEGKVRTPKAKEVRRRNRADAQLPTVPPKPSRPRPAKPFAARKFEKQRAPGQPGGFRPKRPFATDKTFRATRPSGEELRPPAGHTPAGRPLGKPFGSKPATGRPAWKKAGSGERPPYKPHFERPRFDRQGHGEPAFEKPRFDRTGAGPSGGTGRRGGAASGRSRPPQGERGFARPFTPRGDKPGPRSAPPSEKPFRSGGRGGSRPTGDSGPRPAGKTGWKPRPSVGGPARPGAGGHSKPRPAGFSKPGKKGPGPKGKPGGVRRGGSRPGGRKRG